MGYLIAELDFGQAVKAKEDLNILGGNILNTELLLLKLFLASIDAMISMRHDYMMVPTWSGVPVIIHGNKFVGDHYWLAQNLVASTEQLIVSVAVIHQTKKELEIEKKHLKKCPSVMKIAEEQDIEEEQKEIQEKVNEIEEEKKEIEEEKGTDEEEIGEEKKTDEEEIGNGQTYELEEYCFEKDLELEAELEKANTQEVEKKEPPLMEEVEDNAFTVESMSKKMIEVNQWRWTKLNEVSSEEVTASGTLAYEHLVAGGYTEESAKEEELEILQVDDVIWWVCMEDVTKVQKKRLVDLL
ncbi:hypothetical protein BDD12DRAFT_902936 [Trichophaea hybrida]|nr:hypothetical protein BDD12DRAFT_902936 [Trichophaea hybrida]